MVTREQFLLYLRDALNHLYDLNRLRRNPLATILGLADRFDAATALQRALIDAIQSLKPRPGEPPQSPAWRIYEPLFYRYVEQFSAKEVADQLGITTRHLRRWQNTAQEALADRLWQQFSLADTLAEGRQESPQPDLDALQQELAWIQESQSTAWADPGQVLPAVLDLARKLAEQHHVDMEVSLADALP
ncbi:MAG: sigma-70 family RNA polymerase sigma factor, partial [Anaerolineae bacterium]|nr:sigma-70 family RNA polymerase sigma factor [Anaerolineae bacterium]